MRSEREMTKLIRRLTVIVAIFLGSTAVAQQKTKPDDAEKNRQKQAPLTAQEQEVIKQLELLEHLELLEKLDLVRDLPLLEGNGGGK